MNLIIDGNALMNVTANAAMFTLKKNTNFDDPYITVEGVMMLTENSKNYYRSFMLGYISSIMAPLKGAISNVYFVFDSSSWRKLYLKKHFERNPDQREFAYKAKRKVDDHKRQLFMFFSFFTDEMMPEILKIKGIYEFKVMAAEGDDLIAYLVHKLSGNNFIWTVDHDINQFADNDPGKFTIILGPKDRTTQLKKLYYYNIDNDNTPSNIMDFDVSNYGLHRMIDTMVAERGYSSHEVNPNLLLYNKILCGDSSDTIPSIYTIIGLDGRATNITPKKAEKIINEISKKYDINDIRRLVDTQDVEFMEDTVRLVKEVAKTKLDVDDIIRHNYKLNCKLIRLSMNILPEQLVYMMDTKFSYIQNTGAFDYRDFYEFAGK